MELRFSRILPFNYFPKKELAKEIGKIVKFYETENNDKPAVYDFSELKIIDEFKSDPRVKKDETRWLVALGAAFRGLMPRPEDNLVSLMPVGTEEAYEYQKATVFTEFTASLIIGLSVFFSGIFIIAWLMMLSIQQNALNQLESFSSVPLPAGSVELEEKANRFNELVSQTANIVKTFPRWSILLEELKLRVIPGISISNFSLPSPEATFSLNGIAENRDTLNRFKKSLEESPLLAEIKLPLTDLEKKEKIPFSISFKLKDPSILKY
jgi:Tfp pilus assembly protein PilN